MMISNLDLKVAISSKNISISENNLNCADIFLIIFQVCDSRQCDQLDIKIETRAEFDLHSRERQHSSKVSFIGDRILPQIAKNQKNYTKVEIGNEVYEIGNFVQICSIDPSAPPYIGKILSLFTDGHDKIGHVRWFTLGEHTILGSVADPKELFAGRACEDFQLFNVLRKLDIQYWDVSDDWAMLGGTPESIVTPTTELGGSKGSYWYRHLYDPKAARFENVPKMFLNDDPQGLECNSCATFDDILASKKPIYSDDDKQHSFKYNGIHYRVGDGVMLLPKTLRLSNR
jgi:hypothetical protein